MDRILIVEDDNVLREELSAFLKNSGYDTVCITDFDSISHQIQTSDADLILLDINLPGVNGQALLKELRKERDTPVIMLTSRTSELDEVLSMSYGADDYITKPYSPKELVLRVNNIIKRVYSKDLQKITYDEYTIDTDKRLVMKNNNNNT